MLERAKPGGAHSLAEAGFASKQGFLGLRTGNGLGQGAGYGPDGLNSRRRDRVTGKEGNHAQEPAFQQERETGEGNQLLATRPLLFRHVRVADDLVGDERLALLGDPADF